MLSALDPLRALPMSPAQVEDLLTRTRANSFAIATAESARRRHLRLIPGGEAYRDRRNRIRRDHRSAIKAGKRRGNP